MAMFHLLCFTADLFYALGTVIISPTPSLQFMGKLFFLTQKYTHQDYKYDIWKFYECTLKKKKTAGAQEESIIC